MLLIHGGGATHAMMLDQYERWFSQAGFAVLAFDFRHLGESDGEPRQLMSLSRYFQDIDAALAFIRTRPELDAARVALWGTSFGASHVVATAARRNDIAAAVIQCPILQGRAPALSGGLGHLLRFTGPIVSDLLRAALGLGRRYVQIVGRPGELAFVNVAGRLRRLDVRRAAGRDVRWPHHRRRRPVDAVVRRRGQARQVRCPLLVCVSDRENLMKPEIALRVAREAPLAARSAIRPTTSRSITRRSSNASSPTRSPSSRSISIRSDGPR